VSAPTDFAAVKTGLEKAGLKPEIAELTYKPVNDTLPSAKTPPSCGISSMRWNR